MAGFRLERSLPPRDGWSVWEATQVALDRSVVLELLPTPANADPGWAETVLAGVRSSIGPGSETVFAAGVVREGVYVARRSAGPAARRRPARTVVVAAMAAAIALLLGLSRLDQAPKPAVEIPPPPRPANTIAIGAPLTPGATRTEDCTGAAPVAGSPDCTIASTTRVPQTGLVRRWSVRGARGALALQVLRRGADGRFREIRRSQVHSAPDAGPHSFDAAMPVQRGDLVGLVVASGAGVGVRRGAGDAMRWTGPLTLIVGPRRSGTLLGGHEVQLRVDVAPGARRPARPPVPAGPGRVIESLEVESPGGRAARVAVIALPQAIAVDGSIAGREIRLPAPDADPAGALVDLEQNVTDVVVVRLQWRNPREPRLVEHNYIVSDDRVRLVE